MKQISAIDWLIEQMLINNYINKKQYVNCKSWLIDEAKELEKEQTDEFAVEFLKFCNKNYKYGKGFYYMKGDFENSMKLNQKELLEIFKKEKEL
jgi:hypothetical protein